MAFSDPVSNIITQTGVDTDLSLLASSSGVTVIYGGIIPLYVLGDGIHLEVEGTLTINPEVNVLFGNHNQLVHVPNGGILNTGEELTSPVDGSNRFTEGVAIYNSRSQAIWWGGSVPFLSGSSTVTVASGGTWVSKGCTIISPGMFGNQSGAHIWLEKLEWHCQDILVGTDIDPTTGVIATANTGINVGVTQALTNAGRGFIGWQGANDVRWDDVTIIGGGEVDFYQPINAGNNTLSGTPNGYFGYSAFEMKSPILVDAQSTSAPFFTNLNITEVGNGKEVTIQGAGDAGFNHEVYCPNPRKGSSLKIHGAEASSDPRAWGYGEVYRDVDFSVIDADTGLPITGGRTYMLDTNNGERKDNAYDIGTESYDHDNLSDLMYSETFTDGELDSVIRVVTKIVNVPPGTRLSGNSNDPQGTIRTTDLTRTSATVQTLGGDAVEVGDRIRFLVTTTGGVTTETDIIAVAGQTTYSVDTLLTDTTVCQQVEAQNIDWIGDLRGNTNVEGADLFSFHLWRYENQYISLVDTALADDTIGTRIIQIRAVADKNITNTRTVIEALNTSIGTGFVVSNSGITTTSTSVNLDEVYDLTKYKKETSVANIVIPTSSTLILSSDGTEIDMGSNTIIQGTGQWSVGTTHTKFKIATNIDLSKFVLGGGIELSGVQFTVVPSSFDSCTLTNSSETLTTGGKTLGSDVVIDGDWDYSTGGNSFNHTQTGDITTGAGDNTYGADFELTGKLRPGTGNNTFDSGTDVSNVELVALAGSDIAVFGKVAADFVDPLVILTGGSITFPSFPTRLDVNIGPLGGSGTTLLDGTPDGVPYTLCRDGVIEFSGISNGSNIRLSSAAGDGPRTQVSEIAGNWSLGIVDADTRCTFNAIDVEVVTSSSATQFTLVLPPFDPIFNVAVTEVGDRKCTVGAADVVTINEETNTNVQLTGDFPSDSLSNVLNFNNSADAITFMVALGLTSSTARQTTSGDIFLRTGTTPQDFTGVELQRLDSQVAIRSGIATYSSGVVTVSLEGSVDIFLSTGYTAEVVFELEECIGNSYADQPMTSNIFGKARDSINYIEAMRRRIVKSGVPIPTGGSFVTEDICRSVADGADIRHGTYLLQDTQVGVQLVDGLRDVDNVRSFSPGTKSERQLRDLNTGIESDGVTHKVRTTSRLVVSSAEIGAATISDLKDWGNDLTNNVKDSDFTSQTTGIPTQL